MKSKESMLDIVCKPYACMCVWWIHEGDEVKNALEAEEGRKGVWLYHTERVSKVTSAASVSNSSFGHPQFSCFLLPSTFITEREREPWERLRDSNEANCSSVVRQPRLPSTTPWYFQDIHTDSQEWTRKICAWISFFFKTSFYRTLGIYTHTITQWRVHHTRPCWLWRRRQRSDRVPDTRNLSLMHFTLLIRTKLPMSCNQLYFNSTKSQNCTRSSSILHFVTKTLSVCVLLCLKLSKLLTRNTLLRFCSLVRNALHFYTG